MMSINIFIERLTEEQKSEYIKDYIQTAIDLGLSEISPKNSHDLNFIMPYTIVIAYAKK